MVIDDEDVDSDSQYEMENEKDLSNSEIDLEEDIVFGKLFDFSRLSIYCVDSSDHENAVAQVKMTRAARGVGRLFPLPPRKFCNF
jgi:hypothetical protein